jgi:hypothetical protein
VDVSVIIAGIDEQIKRLEEARKALQGISAPTAAGKVSRGRPKGSKTVAPKAAPVAIKAAAPAKAAKSATKRKLSPEGRKRIADAMKRRWAERRKTATKAAPAKTAAK